MTRNGVSRLLDSRPTSGFLGQIAGPSLFSRIPDACLGVGNEARSLAPLDYGSPSKSTINCAFYIVRFRFTEATSVSTSKHRTDRERGKKNRERKAEEEKGSELKKREKGKMKKDYVAVRWLRQRLFYPSSFGSISISESRCADRHENFNFQQQTKHTPWDSRMKTKTIVDDASKACIPARPYQSKTRTSVCMLERVSYDRIELFTVDWQANPRDIFVLGL